MTFRYYKSVDGQMRRLRFVEAKPRLVPWHKDFPPGIAEIWADETGYLLQIPENVWSCLKIQYEDTDYVTTHPMPELGA